jgi:hypothetical protein
MKLGPLQFAKKSCVKGAFRGDVCNRLEVLLKSYEKSINLKVEKKWFERRKTLQYDNFFEYKRSFSKNSFFMESIKS